MTEKKIKEVDEFIKTLTSIQKSKEDFEFLPTADMIVLKLLGKTTTGFATSEYFGERVVTLQNFGKLEERWSGNRKWIEQMGALQAEGGILAYCERLSKLAADLFKKYQTLKVGDEAVQNAKAMGLIQPPLSPKVQQIKAKVRLYSLKVADTAMEWLNNLIESHKAIYGTDPRTGGKSKPIPKVSSDEDSPPKPKPSPKPKPKPSPKPIPKPVPDTDTSPTKPIPKPKPKPKPKPIPKDISPKKPEPKKKEEQRRLERLSHAKVTQALDIAGNRGAHSFRFLPNFFEILSTCCDWEYVNHKRVVDPNDVKLISAYWKSDHPTWATDVRQLTNKKALLSYVHELHDLLEAIGYICEPSHFADLTDQMRATGRLRRTPAVVLDMLSCDHMSIYGLSMQILRDNLDVLDKSMNLK